VCSSDLYRSPSTCENTTGAQPSFGLSLDEIEEWLTDKSAKE